VAPDLGSTFAASGAPDGATFGAVLVSPTAGDVRRAVGPVAWCALEYLAASPCQRHGDANTVLASVRSLADGLRVSKSTAHRALTVLRVAGLVEPLQSRSDAGRFETGCYRLAVSPAVVARVDVGIGECVLGAAPPRAAVESGRARTLRSRSRGGRVEQLVLLPEG
jgi:DNA-binding transcriptional ArsR family regulator